MVEGASLATQWSIESQNFASCVSTSCPRSLCRLPGDTATALGLLCEQCHRGRLPRWEHRIAAYTSLLLMIELNTVHT